MQRLRTVTLLDVSAVAGHYAVPAALLLSEWDSGISMTLHFLRFSECWFCSNTFGSPLVSNMVSTLNIWTEMPVRANNVDSAQEELRLGPALFFSLSPAEGGGIYFCPCPSIILSITSVQEP